MFLSPAEVGCLIFFCFHNKRNTYKNPNKEQYPEERTTIKIDTLSEGIDFCFKEIFINPLLNM